MKKLLILLFLLFPSIAFAQSNRNPCVYISGKGCISVGYTTGTDYVPMSVGGLANAIAPTFTEGLPGYLSFDLSGNLRTTGGGGGGTVTQGNAGTNAQAWWMQIGDTVRGPAKVQAGNVAATTDVSLTVTDPNLLAAVNAAIPAGTNLIGKVGIDQTTDGTTNGVRITNAYPSGATPITASATGTTAATTATLAGTSNKTTYICGYSIRANATAAATVTNTITGVITATLSSIMWIAPLASGLGVDEQIFSPCIPASGTNQAIAVVSGAPGSGGNVSSKAWGYQQ